MTSIFFVSSFPFSLYDDCTTFTLNLVSLFYTLFPSLSGQFPCKVVHVLKSPSLVSSLATILSFVPNVYYHGSARIFKNLGVFGSMWGVFFNFWGVSYFSFQGHWKSPGEFYFT